MYIGKESCEILISHRSICPVSVACSGSLGRRIAQQSLYNALLYQYFLTVRSKNISRTPIQQQNWMQKTYVSAFHFTVANVCVEINLVQFNEKVPSVQFKRFILSDLVHEQASSHFLEVLSKCSRYKSRLHQR